MKGIVLVTLLLAAFISGCVPYPTYEKTVERSQLYEDLNRELQAEVSADQVKIQQLEDRLKVTVLNEILFPEGGWEINEKGRATLNKIIPTLKTLQGKRIQVCGYTDNVPIGHALKSHFPSNWELSAARATDVVRYLVHQGVNPAILSATGFGEQNPAASNDTPQGRQQNRRVEIEITAMSQ